MLLPLLRPHPQEEKQQRTSTDTQSDGGSQSGAANVWLHCSIGPKLEPDEVDETRVQVRVVIQIVDLVCPLTVSIRGQKAQLKPLRGFDRLAAAGFSEQDIASIRSQFHAHSAGDYIDQEFATDEDCMS